MPVRSMKSINAVRSTPVTVNVDLPGRADGRQVLLGDDAVHQHFGRAVDGDGDDHPLPRIEEAEALQLRERRVLAHR